MKAMQAIQIALKFSDGGMKLLEEMKADPLVRPGPWGGNHAMWIAGHLAVIEGRLHKMLHGTPNPVEHWKPLFDWGSQPRDDPSTYPPYDQVLQTFRHLRRDARVPGGSRRRRSGSSDEVSAARLQRVRNRRLGDHDHCVPRLRAFRWAHCRPPGQRKAADVRPNQRAPGVLTDALEDTGRVSEHAIPAVRPDAEGEDLGHGHVINR